MRVRMMTPRYGSNHESKISARSGASAIAARRRHAFHDRLQRFVNADALLGADQKGVARIEADHFFNLFANPLRLGGRQIDFVDDRNDFEIMVQRQISIRERLGFHALRSIHHQQRAFARLQAARNFIREIDMAGRIDQIELIHIAVIGFVIEPDGMGFDGDAAFALEVHGVENLLHHFALGKRSGGFEKTVGQRAFAVVDMRNDREIPDEFGDHAVRWG